MLVITNKGTKTAMLKKSRRATMFPKTCPREMDLLQLHAL